ncbi:MAG: enoyl-[acyl-carrier-protein] reductase FabK [Lachnospiraceae bacterium]|nr:enoyl-[acyl-carrier-protein] reductase FabK [Lachnospiraceae bacterium]
MLNSVLCELLGIRYPVFQGGMAWVADAGLASAVSNAGGLGLIAAMNSNGEQLREQILKAKELTDRPFGVNIMLMSPFVEEALQVVCEEKIPVVTTGAGNPTPYMDRLINAGVKVIPVVPSTAIAKMAARKGATAVIAEGGESGGHVGDLTTMTLVPQVCDAVDIPVIAAGGIGDGRGMAAAFMLGACGVQMGTRFLVADECSIHENYKEKVLKAKDIETIVTGKRLGHPVRSLKTPFSKAFFQKEYDSSVSNEELEKMGAGSLRLAAREGDLERGSFMCGQIAGMVHERMSCEEIIKSVCSEAEEILKGASKWVK